MLIRVVPSFNRFRLVTQLVRFCFDHTIYATRFIFFLGVTFGSNHFTTYSNIFGKLFLKNRRE